MRRKHKVCQSIPLEVRNNVVSAGDTVGSTDNGDDLGGGEADRSEALKDGGDAVSWLRNEVRGDAALGCARPIKNGMRGAPGHWTRLTGSSELDAVNRNCQRELHHS